MKDADRPPRIRRTHISLFVKDPFASGPWYEDVLGMSESARGKDWVFLTFGQKHHDVALIRASREPDAGQDSRGNLNLQHYGLEIDGDLDELRRLYRRLLNKGVPIIKITNHQVGVGLYFEDPDGHRLEFFCETVHDDEIAKQLLKRTGAPSDPYDLEPI